MPASEGTSRGLQYDPILEPLSGVFLTCNTGFFAANFTDIPLSSDLGVFAWSVLGVLLGIATAVAYLVILRVYVERRTTESVSVNEILDRALSRVTVAHDFNTAIIDVERVSVTVLLTPGRRTLVVAKPAALKLLRVPNRAEPFLATKLVELDRGRPRLRTVSYVLLFFACWMLSSRVYGPIGLLRNALQDLVALFFMVVLIIGTLVLSGETMSLSLKSDQSITRNIEELYKISFKQTESDIFGEAGDDLVVEKEQAEAVVHKAWSEGRYRYAVPILTLVIGSTANLVLILPTVSFMLTAPIALDVEMYLILPMMVAAMYILSAAGLWLLRGVFEPNYLVGGVSDSTCSHVERTMHEVLGRENPAIPIVRKDTRHGDLFLVNENVSRGRDDVVHVIPREVLDCLQEDELVGSYIVSLVLLERAYRRQTIRVGGIVVIMMLFAMSMPTLSLYLLPANLVPMALLVPLLLIPVCGIAIYNESERRKKTERTTDVELTRQYSRHPEALKRLIDCGIVTVTGKLSFAKRMKYLQDAGFFDKES